MTSRIINNPIFARLSQLINPIILLHDRNVSNIKEGFVPTRKLTEAEEYIRTILLDANEVSVAVAQLDQALIYIGQYHTNPLLKKKGISRYDHIQYHIENHLIRIATCYDRCLILVNDVLLLGNDHKNCTNNVIINNSHVKATTIDKQLETIGKKIEKFRRDRNIVVHRRSYSDEELRIVEAYAVATKDDPKKLIQNAFRRVTNAFVVSRKEELELFNNDLCVLINKLFDELLEVFNMNYRRMMKA